MSYQKIIVVGHVGKAPEMRYMPSGEAVTTFSLATNREYTNSQNEKIKEATWFRVTTFGKLAEVVNQYLRKGSQCLVEGRLSIDKATGGPRVWHKQDGTPAANFEIAAGTVRFLTAKRDDQDETPKPDIPAEFEDF